MRNLRASLWCNYCGFKGIPIQDDDASTRSEELEARIAELEKERDEAKACESKEFTLRALVVALDRDEALKLSRTLVQALREIEKLSLSIPSEATELRAKIHSTAQAGIRSASEAGVAE